MPWSSSNRKKRFNKGWAKTRAKIMERDHHMCQWPVTDENGFPAGICGAPAEAVDHILHNMVQDDDSPRNLRALCHYHHALKTGVESVQGRYRANARRRDQSFYERPAFR